MPALECSGGRIGARSWRITGCGTEPGVVSDMIAALSKKSLFGISDLSQTW